MRAWNSTPSSATLPSQAGRRHYTCHRHPTALHFSISGRNDRQMPRHPSRRRAALVAGAAAALLFLTVAAQARALLEDQQHGSPRSAQHRGLQQQQQLPQATQARKLNCSKAHAACVSCRLQKVVRSGAARTVTLCDGCAAGWQLRRDGKHKQCDCAPGYFLVNSTTASGAPATCEPCPQTLFCTGGDAKNNPGSAALHCPRGLATRIVGAKSQAQCLTLPGFGRRSQRRGNGAIVLSAEECPVGTYNVGSNTASCQSCGPGLTTNGTGATSASACRPASGTFLSKGVGRPCPKGSHGDGLSGTCTACAAGVTTAGEGSTSAADCDRAVKGYSYDGDGTASPCELNTFNANETTASSCTPCPSGWRTQDVGATGPAFCLAPPGYELVEGSANISRCPIGFWKEGWSRNPCQSCGKGLTTDGPGADSRDACLVPAGAGLTSLAPLEATWCVQNTFGQPTARPAIASSTCTPCPPDTFTADVLSNTTLIGRGYTSASACTPCPAGYTTSTTGSSPRGACSILPGWVFDAALGAAKPCPAGSWSAGEDASQREPTSCTPCPAGFTTAENGASTATNCSICAAGRGGTDCSLCPANTYAAGNLPAGEPCSPCADGTVSAPGASSSDQCVPSALALHQDVFPVLAANATGTNSSRFVTLPDISTAAGCQDACVSDDACMQFRFADASARCQLQREDASGSGALGFKVAASPAADAGAAAGMQSTNVPVAATPMLFVVYRVDERLSMGRVLTSPPSGAVSREACIAACSNRADCEGFLFGIAGCSLLASKRDTSYSGMVHVVPAKLVPAAAAP